MIKKGREVLTLLTFGCPSYMTNRFSCAPALFDCDYVMDHVSEIKHYYSQCKSNRIVIAGSSPIQV